MIKDRKIVRILETNAFFMKFTAINYNSSITDKQQTA